MWLALVNVWLGDGVPRWVAGIGKYLAMDGLSRLGAGIGECLARGLSAEMGGWHW